jgi:dipeptide/tripeptide permease
VLAQNTLLKHQTFFVSCRPKRIHLSMKIDKAKKSGFGSFTKNYWVAILMEFFERGSYYGVMSVLSVYLVMNTADGGLGFSKESVGVIKSTITPLLYLLPILAGALADRFGYRRLLMLAFALMSLGYLLTSQVTSYTAVFASLLLMAVGAGIFKPIISGTIARETDESNSSLGFGIFYWSINLGAFIFPLILVPYLKGIGWSWIFIMAAIGTGWLLLLNLLAYKEPPRPENTRSLGEVLQGIVLVLKDYRFVIMIVIYSMFWILYFQMFDTVLWYLTEKVDMSPVNNAVNGLLGLFGAQTNWQFDAEHVTVVNAGTIIALQLVVSSIVKNTRALPTMIFGIALGTAGMAMLAVSMHAWVFVAGLVLFSIGEMTAHPKFISYVGLIAPPDKKALYLGYSFLYGVIGSGVGGILGAYLYVFFVEQRNQPAQLWLVFSMIGVLTIVGLYLYDKFLAPERKTA